MHQHAVYNRLTAVNHTSHLHAAFSQRRPHQHGAATSTSSRSRGDDVTDDVIAVDEGHDQGHAESEGDEASTSETTAWRSRDTSQQQRTSTLLQQGQSLCLIDTEIHETKLKQGFTIEIAVTMTTGTVLRLVQHRGT